MRKIGDDETELKKHICGIQEGETLGFTPRAWMLSNKIDYVEFDMGGRYLLIPFKLLECWYELARLSRSKDIPQEEEKGENSAYKVCDPDSGVTTDPPFEVKNITRPQLSDEAKKRILENL